MMVYITIMLLMIAYGVIGAALEIYGVIEKPIYWASYGFISCLIISTILSYLMFGG